MDFSALYDEHPEYIARRAPGSFAQAQIDLEVRFFKLPFLMALLPPRTALASVMEIGCATGELLAAIPVAPGGRKWGVDVSAENIAAARARFAQIDFHAGDFRDLPVTPFDAVVMSDVLEHVPDDVAFLQQAAQWGKWVLINLPLEDNWLNRNRNYGPDDASGHLRKYALQEGLALIDRAGLELLAYQQVWSHETPLEPARRALRQQMHGAAFSGNWLARKLRAALFYGACSIRPLGRRLFASNLFALARAKSVS